MVTIPPQILDEIQAHAEEAYPEECCGVVLSREDARDSLTTVRRCRNALNRFHEMDPVVFPRTNRSGYLIDPTDLVAVDRECRLSGQHIRVVYHSHPDVGVYFSEEDQRCAIVDNEPLHPGVDFLVVSVVNGRAIDSGLFSWSQENDAFIRTA